jgi:hypothetical protein
LASGPAGSKIKRETVNLDILIDKALSRRTFLAGAGAAAAATVAGCSSDGIVTTTPQYTDADVLNYALNLEYLEAQFYLYAATGKGLAAADIAAPLGYGGSYTVGTVTTTGNIAVGSVAGLTAAQQAILNEIAYEEQEHVRFLRSALGSAAVPMPSIDLTFFSSLAVTAGIASANSGSGAFSPYASFDALLTGAFVFEDVGVTAYAGAAPMISSAGVTAGYLTAAAGILAVEAYHAGYIRTALTSRAIAAGSANAYPYLGYANQIEAVRADLTVGNTAAPNNSGSVETLLTLPSSTSSPSAVAAASSGNAIGFARNINQVLHIVYANGTVGAKSGGFFPNGINSIFATTTA